jgi:hypothetical protein
VLGYNKFQMVFGIGQTGLSLTLLNCLCFFGKCWLLLNKGFRCAVNYVSV